MWILKGGKISRPLNYDANMISFAYFCLYLNFFLPWLLISKGCHLSIDMLNYGHWAYCTYYIVSE